MAIFKNPSPEISLCDLPNEVFVQILTPLSTHALLALSTVSHRFHALILRVLHYRLKGAAPLKDYQLMLECYHPGATVSGPYTFCKYLGTDGLSGRHEGKGSLYEDVEIAHQLGKLGSVYSRFRPDARVEEKTSGARLVVSSSGKSSSLSQGIDIEKFEDFSQLCVNIDLVKVLPRSNLVLSAVSIEQGVIRLFKNWLHDRNSAAGQCSSSDKIPEASASSSKTSELTHHQMLWVDGEQNVGLKMRVTEKKFEREAPITPCGEEEISASFEVEIEEIHIRTTRLLVTVEKSLQDLRKCARTVIFTRA